MNYHLTKLSDVNPDLAEQLKSYCYDLNGLCQTVHQEMGPFLNEYIYQEALAILLEEKNITPRIKEYYFSVEFHGRRIQHKHFVDFFVKNSVFIECKAVEKLCPEHRQQLWNYMRLAKVRIGILWNFAPIKDQSEHYYLDTETNSIFLF